MFCQEILLQILDEKSENNFSLSKKIDKYVSIWFKF